MNSTQPEGPGHAPPVDFSDLLFLGTHGKVAALHKRSGQEIWRLDLDGAAWGLPTLLVEDGVLYAGAHGHLYAIDPIRGKLLWCNGLKGMSHKLISMATARNFQQPHQNPALQAQQAAQQAMHSGGVAGT